MDFKQIQDLIRLVNKSDLTEVQLEEKDFKLKIKRERPSGEVVVAHSAPAAAPAPQQAPQTAAPQPEADAPKEAHAADNLHTVVSPMIGTFYRKPAPDKPVYVKVGDTVEKGQTLCIIEAMKLFNEIEAETSGKIVKILVEDAQPVEYEQGLFLIDPGA